MLLVNWPFYFQGLVACCGYRKREGGQSCNTCETSEKLPLESLEEAPSEGFPTLRKITLTDSPQSRREVRLEEDEEEEEIISSL